MINDAWEVPHAQERSTSPRSRFYSPEYKTPVPLLSVGNVPSVSPDPQVTAGAFVATDEPARGLQDLWP